MRWICMSKKHPNEGNMHFVYGARVSNGKKKRKRTPGIELRQKYKKK